MARRLFFSRACLSEVPLVRQVPEERGAVPYSPQEHSSYLMISHLFIDETAVVMYTISRPLTVLLQKRINDATLWVS
jgi:hypothetical protein